MREPGTEFRLASDALFPDGISISEVLIITADLIDRFFYRATDHTHFSGCISRFLSIDTCDLGATFSDVSFALYVEFQLNETLIIVCARA